MNTSLLTFLGNDSGFGDNNNSAYIEFDNNLSIFLMHLDDKSYFSKYTNNNFEII